jgi:hypothetical protein
MATRLLLVCPDPWLAEMQDLCEAWKANGIDVCHRPYLPQERDLPPLGDWVRTSQGLAAGLLIGARRRAPSTVLEAPFATDLDGKRVPLAWLPATDATDLRRFAATAARVQRRQATERGVALFGQWHPRYLRLVDRVTNLLAARWRTFRWTGDSLSREDLVAAIGSGLGLGIYMGHGRPVGWVGYHGVRRHHFDRFGGEPMGAMLSLCCRTASRRRTSLSYAEALPLAGVTAASFGAISDTLHTDNTRWAVGLCEALSQGVTTVGELITKAAPASPTAVVPYRLIGDPLAPLASVPDDLARAAAVMVQA